MKGKKALANALPAALWRFQSEGMEAQEKGRIDGTEKLSFKAQYNVDG